MAAGNFSATILWISKIREKNYLPLIYSSIEILTSSRKQYQILKMKKRCSNETAIKLWVGKQLRSHKWKINSSGLRFRISSEKKKSEMNENFVKFIIFQYFNWLFFLINSERKIEKMKSNWQYRISLEKDGTWYSEWNFL